MKKLFSLFLMSCDECGAAHIENESDACPVCKMVGKLEELKSEVEKLKKRVENPGDYVCIRGTDHE